MTYIPIATGLETYPLPPATARIVARMPVGIAEEYFVPAVQAAVPVELEVAVGFTTGVELSVV